MLFKSVEYESRYGSASGNVSDIIVRDSFVQLSGSFDRISGRVIGLAVEIE